MTESRLPVSQLRSTMHPAEVGAHSLRELLRAAREQIGSSPLLLLAVTLVIGDLLFMLAEVLVEVSDYGFPGANRVSLQTEGGVAEAFGYGKMIAAGAVAYAGFQRWRTTAALSWTVILGYMALDDALALHERLGTSLAASLGFADSGSLRAQDLGELVGFAFIGVGLMAVLVVGEKLDRAPSPTALTRMVMVGAVILGFFAVGVDALARDLPFEVVIEDGGELLAQSLILLLTIAWYRFPDRVDHQEA